MQVALRELKEAISKGNHDECYRDLFKLLTTGFTESFEQKGKFPPSLKPILAQVAVKAIQCGEYNDNFFSLMPKLFIYNKFTMTVCYTKVSILFIH